MLDAKNQLDHVQLRYNQDYAYPDADRIRIETAVELIGTSKLVLDVGAYDGQISARIAAAASNQVVAFDGSKAALDIARGRGLATQLGDIAARWPFDDEAFDAVFAGEIIEHLIDTDFFLHECGRVLKSGGMLVLTTPNLASLGRRLMLLIGKNPYVDTALREDQAGHVRFFVYDSLLALLQENAFAVVKATGDVVVLAGDGHGSRLLANWFPGSQSHSS